MVHCWFWYAVSTLFKSTFEDIIVKKSFQSVREHLHSCILAGTALAAIAQERPVAADSQLSPSRSKLQAGSMSPRSRPGWRGFVDDCMMAPLLSNAVAIGLGDTLAVEIVEIQDFEFGQGRKRKRFLAKCPGQCREVGMHSPNREEASELDSGILEMQGLHPEALLKQILKIFGITDT
ncbi:hypothetical protein DFQ27_002737 [Actinomortierella ambigua]|uniref:Uncharacterized protein n=1 Tax=Actinomortierella ambigua TaxID=1343610 RepID=A0A9P6QB72_9FUNG|nr:hypothetical protein DFQ26_007972 [Actinomortierella ambigua]KAG0261858.1 hypothetical protein DFQ27_002737 [Actinomortierella ambigua]